MPQDLDQGGSVDGDENKHSKTRRIEEWVSGVSRANSPAPDGVMTITARGGKKHGGGVELPASNGADAGGEGLSHRQYQTLMVMPTEERLHARGGAADHGNTADRMSVASSDNGPGGHAHGNGYAASDAGSDAQSRHSDIDATLDFRRGKRFHKLSRLMGTGAAQLATWRFRWHSVAIWVVLLAVCTACFVGLTVAINDQISFIDDMTNASYGTKAMLYIATLSRIISNIHAGIPNILYSAATLPFMHSLLETSLEDFRVVHSGVYLGFSKLRQLPTVYNLSDTWEKPWRNVQVMYDTKPPSYAVVPNNLWVEGNKYLAAGGEVLQNHNAWAAAGTTISSHADFYYVIKNGAPDMYLAYKLTLDGFSRRAGDSTHNVNQLQIIFLIVQGCVVCLLASVYAGWLLHRVSEQRYRLFSVFLAVPQGFVRALATKQVRLDDDSEDDSDAEVNDLPAASSAIAVKVVTASDVNGDGASAKSSRFGFWHSLWSEFSTWVVFWKPLMVAGGKRRLLRDGRDTYWLIAPFLLWMAAIIAMYIAGYYALSSMLQPIQGLNLINSVRVRSLRLFFWAHEAASLRGDPVAVKYAITQMVADASSLQSGYTALLFGAKSSASLATNPLYSKMVKGIPFYSQAAADIFFKTGTCLQLAASKCQTPDSPYYQVSRSGLDAMMQRYLQEAVDMGKDNVTDISLNSTRLNYIFSFAPNDIYDGWLGQAELALGNVVSYYNRVKSVDLAVFIVAWFYAGIYLLFFMRTFLARVAREGRQVADLLSQLPKDVDVEALVRRMMLQAPGATSALAALAVEERPLLAGSSMTEGGKSFNRAGGSQRHFSATNKVAPLIRQATFEVDD